MLKLRVVQARYGDCLIIECGYGKRRKHILIDGGPGKVYQPYLAKELQRITQAGGQIDLLVLTHIDNDHVLGLLELMVDLKNARQIGEKDIVPIRRIWHNAFKKILPEAGQEADQLEEQVMMQPVKAPDDPHAAGEEGGPLAEEIPDLGAIDFGVGEGVKLQLADEALGIPRNYGFKDGLVTLERARQPERLGAIRFWVVGPNGNNLADLRKKWMGWLDQQAGRISFDVTATAEKAVEPDDSVNNLSSIMLLVESGGKRILLTGDGRSEDIVTGLEQLGLLLPGGTFHVDILKLPHHGSARNAVGELFDRVTADTYVISADGKHGNPDWPTLVWLVDAACRQNRDIHIFATNWTPSLRRLVAERPGSANHYRLTVMEVGVSSYVL